jgi:palmitoyltransferase
MSKSHSYVNAAKLFQISFSNAMMAAGPLLILVATSLVTYVMSYGIMNVVPLYGKQGSFWWAFHSCIACFLGFNILFNYATCILTDAGSSGSQVYIKLIQEARALGQLPTNPIDDETFVNGSSVSSSLSKKSTYSNPTSIRKRGDGVIASTVVNSASSTNSTNTNINTNTNTNTTQNINNINNGSRNIRTNGWLDRGAYEWGYCNKTKSPKAPRSHFDSITKKQILNMDHYCPWMFRPIGYMNYRYFWLFLFWVWIGCLYCISMTVVPFISLSNRRPVLGITVPRKSRSTVSFIFIITSSVCLAVSILFFWHVYLLLTAQTTIEFHGNRTRARRAKAHGELFVNPYSLGFYRNWCQVFGTGNMMLAVLPSFRLPPWPPYPKLQKNINGKVRQLEV